MYQVRRRRPTASEVPSHLIQNQRNSSRQQIAGRLFRIQGNQLHRRRDVVRAENQAARLEFRIAERKVRAVPHRVKVGTVRPVGKQRDCSDGQSAQWLQAAPKAPWAGRPPTKPGWRQSAARRGARSKPSRALNLKPRRGKCSISWTADGRITGSKSAVACETTGTAPALSSSGQNPPRGSAGSRSATVRRWAARTRSIASSESCRRLCRKLERCACPKPVCRANKETLTVPRWILRSSSRRRRSCIWLKFICGKFATSNECLSSLLSHGKLIRAGSPSF